MGYSLGDFVEFPNLSGGGAGDYEFPEDLDRLPGYVQFQPLNELDKDFGTRIRLPLPPSILIGDAATYENADLGMVTASLAEGSPAEFEQKLSKILNLSAGEAKKIGKSVMAKVGGNRSEYLAKETSNPNTRALFKQVSLRQFQFGYKLIPSNATESKKIKDIITEFRKELYPEHGSVSEVLGDGKILNLTYKFPKKYNISMYVGPVGSGKMIEPMLKPCFLTSFQATYNTQTIVRDGKKGDDSIWFAETDISMNFLEAETLSHVDIKRGY